MRGCAHVCLHCMGCAQDSLYVVAVRNYSPEDGDQLSFHKGDIIHLQPQEHPERGEGAPHSPPYQNTLKWGAEQGQN